MPPEFTMKSPGTSQAADMRGKAPMASAPPNMPMNQSPQYTTTTTARPYTGNSQDPTFQMPNASADSMLMQQRFMTQPGYVNSMMMPNYQSSVGLMPMNANGGWLGQQVFPQTPQQVSARPNLLWIPEPRVAQPADESWAADRRTADRRAIVWWSADGWQDD